MQCSKRFSRFCKIQQVSTRICKIFNILQDFIYFNLFSSTHVNGDNNKNTQSRSCTCQQSWCSTVVWTQCSVGLKVFSVLLNINVEFQWLLGCLEDMRGRPASIVIRTFEKSKRIKIWNGFNLALQGVCFYQTPLNGI